MGYLEIKKTKKSNIKSEKINLDDLMKQYDFIPSISINEYLAYAFNNYEKLIKEAIKFHQHEIVAKNIKIDNMYILQNTKNLDEIMKKDKDEYYRQLFIFEYLEKFK